METQVDRLYLVGELYSRTGKSVNKVAERRGKSLGVVAVETPPKKGKKKKKLSQKVSAKPSRSPDDVPKSVLKLEEMKGPMFSTVSRDKVRRSCAESCERPCVGQYTPNYKAVVKSVFKPFFGNIRGRSTFREGHKESLSTVTATQPHEKLVHASRRDSESVLKTRPADPLPQENTVQGGDESRRPFNTILAGSPPAEHSPRCGNKDEGNSRSTPKYNQSSHRAINQRLVSVDADEIPEKPRAHCGSIELSKQSRRRYYYEDGPTANDNRFENIDKLPPISTKCKYVSKCYLGRMSPRRAACLAGVSFVYNPHKEAVLKNEAYALKFGGLTGRKLKGSIYRDFVPPDVENSTSLLKGFDQLGHLKKSAQFDIQRMSPRDDRMYKQTEAYRPDEIVHSEVIRKLLDDIEYSKTHNVLQL